MALPQQLEEAVFKEIEGYRCGELTAAREQLSEHYRTPVRQSPCIENDLQRASYMATRFPATYAVVQRVLNEVSERFPFSFRTLLDLGAGPGTVMWAATELFSSIKEVTLIERDLDFSILGRRLASQSELPSVRNANWQLCDMEEWSTSLLFDLVVLSYSIGEITSSEIPPLIEKWWNHTASCLVIIEPGTPSGFERIRAIRTQLIALGGHPVAPCPHSNLCPMDGTNWCHFSERIDRSSLHRRIKMGTLGHEDEKFSYVVFSKTPCQLPQARILRHPVKRSGHVLLTLCTETGVEERIVSKRDREHYKATRKLEWGEIYR